MKILNLLEDVLNEMPLGLSDEQRKEWMMTQASIFNKIASKNGWEKNSEVYLKNLFRFGKIFADKYDGNFNKIHSLSKENIRELERLLGEV